MDSKSSMRKSLTVPNLIYKLTRNKSDTDRLQVFDAIFDSQFGGKKIEYDKLSPIAETIVLCLEIEINKMEKQYKNGCKPKTYNEKTKK